MTTSNLRDRSRDREYSPEDNARADEAWAVLTTAVVTPVTTADARPYDADPFPLG